MAAILQLPGWLGGVLAMLATITASVLPFVLFRGWLGDELPTRTRDVVETVAIRIGTVHGLILALVFAEAQSAHTSLQQDVSKEVATIEHIALQLNQWNGPEEEALRKQLAAYIAAVLQSEWQPSTRLNAGREAGRAYNDLDAGILNLEAKTPQQQSLRARMIANMDDLQDDRKARLSLLHRGLPSLFWWMALTGFGIIAGCFLVFPVTPVHIAVLSVYGAYTGLALYFILALSHPYAGPAAIDTSAYTMVLNGELKTP